MITIRKKKKKKISLHRENETDDFIIELYNAQLAGTNEPHDVS